MVIVWSWIWPLTLIFKGAGGGKHSLSAMFPVFYFIFAILSLLDDLWDTFFEGRRHPPSWSVIALFFIILVSTHSSSVLSFTSFTSFLPFSSGLFLSFSLCVRFAIIFPFVAYVRIRQISAQGLWDQGPFNSSVLLEKLWQTVFLKDGLWMS